jgi:hypothetical protein
MAAAEHGATFPMAKKLRASMSHQQLHDFAATPRKGLPAHAATSRSNVVAPAPIVRAAPAAVPHPHRNLGAFLHKAKKPGAALADNITKLRSAGAFRPGKG